MIKLYLNIRSNEVDLINYIERKTEGAYIIHPQVHPADIEKYFSHWLKLSPNTNVHIFTNDYFIMQEYDLHFLKNPEIESAVYSKYEDDKLEYAKLVQDLENNEVYEVFENLFKRGIDIK